MAQDLRDVTAKIRAIELFNPGRPSPGYRSPFLIPSASIYSVAVGFSARLAASLFVAPFVPLFSARSMSCSFCHAPVARSYSVAVSLLSCVHICWLTPFGTTAFVTHVIYWAEIWR